MGALASTLTTKEKYAIYNACEKYLLSDLVVSKKYLFCMKEEKKMGVRILTIPYKLVSDFHSLSIPDDGEFFKPRQFYSNMNDSFLSDEEYENVKKIYKTLENLIKFTTFKIP